MDIEEGYYVILEAARDKGRKIYDFVMKELESEFLQARRPCSIKNTEKEKAAKIKRKRERDKLRINASLKNNNFTYIVSA